MHKRIIPEIVLILVNLIPLIGMLFFGWELFQILIFYWIETLIIGAFASAKIFYAALKTKFEQITLGMILGGIGIINMCLVTMLIHGIGIMIIVGFLTGDMSIGPKLLNDSFGEIILSGLFFTVSHGLSYYYNFLGKREFTLLDKIINEEGIKGFNNLKIQKLFIGGLLERIITMQLLVFFGGFIVLATKLPIYIVILFVGLKIAVELNSNLKEHAQTL